MIVVDTNIIAYLYLPSPFTAPAEALLQREPQWTAPLLWRSELRNILAGCLRRGQLHIDQAILIQREAESLILPTFDVDSEAVLRLVQQSQCSAYDCEFVALAQHLDVPLVTMDKQLLRGFASVAMPLVARDAVHEPS